MRILGDYHTHTDYTHGKSTVLENAEVAKQKNIKEIAITDHAYKHALFGMKRVQMPQQRKDVEMAKKETGVNVLFGQEFNLLGLNGETDILAEDTQNMDVVILGYHLTGRPFTFKDRCKLFWKNRLLNIFKIKPSKETIQNNTNAYIKALKRYNIDIIAHLNYGIKVDAVQIAKEAKKCGAYIELNGKRCLFTKDEIVKMVALKTKFILNSDAHSKERIGECKDGLKCALINLIPEELLVNVNKIPTFKDHKGDK